MRADPEPHRVPVSLDGKTALQGAELAVEQINAAGGINGRKLELVAQDDQAKPEQAVPRYPRILDTALGFVLGLVAATILARGPGGTAKGSGGRGRRRWHR